MNVSASVAGRFLEGDRNARAGLFRNVPLATSKAHSRRMVEMLLRRRTDCSHGRHDKIAGFSDHVDERGKPSHVHIRQEAVRVVFLSALRFWHERFDCNRATASPVSLPSAAAKPCANPKKARE